MEWEREGGRGGEWTGFEPIHLLGFFYCLCAGRGVLTNDGFVEKNQSCHLYCSQKLVVCLFVARDGVFVPWGTHCHRQHLIQQLGDEDHEFKTSLAYMMRLWCAWDMYMRGKEERLQV